LPRERHGQRRRELAHREAARSRTRLRRTVSCITTLSADGGIGREI